MGGLIVLSNSLWWASGIGLGFYAYCRRSGGWGSYFWSGRPLHYYNTVFGSWSVNHFFCDWQYETFCSACEKNQSAKLWHRTCHRRNTSYMAPSIYYPCVMTHGNSWFCFVLAFWMWFHSRYACIIVCRMRGMRWILMSIHMRYETFVMLLNDFKVKCEYYCYKCWDIICFFLLTLCYLSSVGVARGWRNL